MPCSQLWTRDSRLAFELNMGNIVAIVGRPNVGKSTLFNRLTEQKEAITDPTAGTTRDRHYGKSEWNGCLFSVIDTGGYVSGSDDIFESEIRRQVALAIDESDTILFMVDVMGGITALDQSIAEMLRRSKKPEAMAAEPGGPAAAAERGRDTGFGTWPPGAPSWGTPFAGTPAVSERVVGTVL